MDPLKLVKTIHIICAACSVSMFFVRGVWHAQSSIRLRQKWVRYTPHVIDTLLLASGVVLMTLTGQYPGTAPWLTVKLIAVVIYIGLGILAFRFARSNQTRLLVWLAALAVFAYVVSIALTRQIVP